MGKRVALMPIGLDAIGIEMHHQLADLAAGIRGDRHGRKGVERPTHALLPSGGKDCEAARPDPCCRLGGGQAGRVSRLFHGGERRALRGLAAGAGSPMVEKGLGGAMTRQGRRGGCQEWTIGPGKFWACQGARGRLPCPSGAGWLRNRSLDSVHGVKTISHTPLLRPCRNSQGGITPSRQTPRLLRFAAASAPR
jgi:hypothetical protein